MSALKCRSAQLQPLAPFGFDSHSIDRVDQRVTGGHVSPPLRFVDTFSAASCFLKYVVAKLVFCISMGLTLFNFFNRISYINDNQSKSYKKD